MRLKHTVYQCSSSTTIKVESGKHYFFPVGEFIEPKYIKFITATKKEVCQAAKDKNLKEVKPRFIRFSPIFSGAFEHGPFEYSEVDIVGAYWYTAYDFGLISERTYKEGLEVPKKIRLMALGAAATTKDVMEFDGMEYTYKGLEYDENGRLAFFNVAKRVDDILNYIFDTLPTIAAFYWVDALFVKTQFADVVVNMLSDFGYQSKKTPLFSFVGCPIDNTICSQKIVSENGKFFCLKQKIYFKPKKKPKKVL